MTDEHLRRYFQMDDQEALTAEYLRRMQRRQERMRAGYPKAAAFCLQAMEEVLREEARRAMGLADELEAAIPGLVR